MKRVFYMLLATLALAGCQKSEESVASSESEAISFSAGTLTRASTKVTWTEGDQIAIFSFVSNLEEPTSTSVPLIYNVVDADGTLEAADNCYYVEDGMSYMAIYPYKEGYSYASYSYEAATNFSYVDMLSTTATSVEDEKVTLQFDHVYARLELTFTYDAAEFAEILIELMVNEDEDDEDGITLENIGSGMSTKATVSAFVAAGEVPSSVVAYIYIDEEEKEPVTLSDYIFNEDSGSNVWVAGENYQLEIEVEDLIPSKQ